MLFVRLRIFIEGRLLGTIVQLSLLVFNNVSVLEERALG